MISWASFRAWLKPGRYGAGEIVTLAAILVAAGGIWAFAELADEVLEGEARAVDAALLLALRNPADPADPLGPHWLEVAMLDLTALGGYTVITLAGALAFGYLIILRRRVAASLLVVALLGGTALNNLLKYAFDRPRPDLVAHLVEVQTTSFPSGHAMLSAVAYLTLGALIAATRRQRRMKLYVLAASVLLALLVGASRVYLGVHWPTDVLAGWCLGAAWAMAFWLLARRLEARNGEARPPAG